MNSGLGSLAAFFGDLMQGADAASLSAAQNAHAAAQNHANLANQMAHQHASLGQAAAGMQNQGIGLSTYGGGGAGGVGGGFGQQSQINSPVFGQQSQINSPVFGQMGQLGVVGLADYSQHKKIAHGMAVMRLIPGVRDKYEGLFDLMGITINAPQPLLQMLGQSSFRWTMEMTVDGRIFVHTWDAPDCACEDIAEWDSNIGYLLDKVARWKRRNDPLSVDNGAEHEGSGSPSQSNAT